MCSPEVGGFLPSCSREGSAGDISHTSSRAPWLRWSTLAASALSVYPGARQSTGMLQSILRSVLAGAVDLTPLPISTFHPEPWTPPHPCSKLLPRNPPCEPGWPCQGHAAGELWQTTARQVGPVDRQAEITAPHSSGEEKGSSPPSLVPTAVPAAACCPATARTGRRPLLSGSQGLNSTSPHLGAEQECVALGKSRCTGHFCLCSDLYCGVARAPLGARGFCGGGINPCRGRKGRRGAFNLLQLLCICHTPFKCGLEFYTR